MDELLLKEHLSKIYEKHPFIQDNGARSLVTDKLVAEEFYKIGYNAAIDDCKTYIGLHRRYAEHSIDDYVNYLQMASWLNNKIAEQINSK